MIFDKSRKHAGRIRDILGVFTKHGLGAVLLRLGLGDYSRWRIGTHADLTPAGMREALEELGPTFVKLGQILSMRPDIIPEEYAREFAKLQDTASTLPASEIRAVIEQEFGAPVDSVFTSFVDVPIAAASLGQVHSARLYDGTEVIVKVQRPGIRTVIEADIEILYRFARFLEGRWDKAKTYGLTELVDEFAITIREELDYTREGRNTDRLRANLSDVKEARVPQVYWDYTTPRVLTIERLNGIKISHVDELRENGHDLKVVAARLGSVFMKQIFVDGFFHADPHPGNILVMEDDVIGLVDCGQVGRMDATTKAGAVRMLIAFQKEDTRAFTQEIITLGISRGEVDARLLTRDLEKVLRHYYDLPARNIDVGAILTRTLDVSSKHKLRLPISFAVMGKVLANLDSINRRLDPDFNFTESAKPYISIAVRQELSVSSLTSDLYRAVIDLRSFLFALPEYTERIMRKAVEGTLKLEVRAEGIEDLSSKLDKVSNRLAFALITVGIIVGSSLIVVAGRGPQGWYGMPLLGIIGFLIATILGLYLIVQIIRSGKLH